MKFLSRFGLATLMGNSTRRGLAAAVLLTFHLMSNSVQGANLCNQTSHDTLTSCNFGVKSNYSLAIAKCDNLPARSENRACVQQAGQDKKSGFEECRAQFDARQEICKTLGKDAYNPIINPADFVPVINNLYFPLTPGTTYVYEGITEKGIEHNEVYITHDTKVILGVTCTVVKDTVRVDGVLVEETTDWYAQDKSGNVWYFGENALEYNEDGLIVSLGGSWMAGVDGAKPGIVMKVGRHVGDLYRQEFALGVAEDMAEILGLNESTIVPLGTYNQCIKTKDFSPLEPDVVEHKFYAPGIGNVQAVDPNTGEHLDLINIITE